MKNIIKNTKYIAPSLLALVFTFGISVNTVNAQWSTGDYYTGGISDYSSSYGGSSNYGGWSTGDYYTGGVSDYSSGWSTGDYYTGGVSDYSTNWASSFGGWGTGDYYTGGVSDYSSNYCSGGNCGGYSDWASSYGGYSDYATSYCGYGNCGSGGSYGYTPSGRPSYGGGSVARGLGGLSFGLNYQDNDTTTTITEDNDWTYTDNSDRSVNIHEDNDTTTTTITNTNVTDSYNTNSYNTVVSRDRDDDNDLDVICRVSDTSVAIGDVVTYEVSIRGGDSPYDIEWRGAIDGNDGDERVRYNQAGRYEVGVIVTDDDGRRGGDDCSVVTVGNYSGGTLVTSNTTYVPTGQYASLSAVSLSQVPYTGPADVAKVFGAIALVVIAGTAIVLWVRKRNVTTQSTNNIAAFKQANKEAVTIQ